MGPTICTYNARCNRKKWRNKFCKIVGSKLTATQNQRLCSCMSLFFVLGLYHCRTLNVFFTYHNFIPGSTVDFILDWIGNLNRTGDRSAKHASIANKLNSSCNRHPYMNLCTSLSKRHLNKKEKNSNATFHDTTIISQFHKKLYKPYIQTGGYAKRKWKTGEK